MKSFVLSILLILPVLGQEAVVPEVVPPRPPVPVNPDPNDLPPTPEVPAALAGGFAVDPGAIAIPVGQVFDYQNMTGQEAANLYNKHTGIRVIVQSAAAQAELKITQPGPLTNGELASILEKQLLLEGFMLIASGENEVKLVMSSGPTDGPGAGPIVLGSGDELPEGDVFLTYVMQLQYLKPDEALRAFQQVVGTYGPGGKVAAVPNAASVVINANTALIKSLVALKKQIDVPSSQVGTKFVEVTYADVEELAERLNEIFNNQREQSAGVQRTANNGSPAVPGLPAAMTGGGAATSAAGEETPISILPDTRTNRLFLMGRPVDLVFVAGLIEDFDAPSSKRNFLRHKLRYLPVSEFMPVAADALERTLESGTAGGGGTAGGSSRSTASRSTGTSSRATSNNTGGGGLGGDTGGGGSRAELSQQSVETAPESMLVGKTLLVADNISNSIIVQGPPHHVEVVENLIRELDQASEQVAITAVFGRYDVTKGGSFGVDLVHILDKVGGEFNLGGVNRNGVPSVIDPSTLTDIASTIGAAGSAGNGLSLYGMVGQEFGVFVNAVESNSNFVAISRPTVFTTNNHEARISSGARIAVPTSTFTGNNVSGGQSTNVEFRDVVLELVVLPLVNDENTVTLQISLVRDDVGEDRNVGELIVPDIITDELTTTVTVPNRSTIILGGLITETNRQSKTGIPILSTIPGIGRLFGRTTDAIERQELVMMIHPSIITNDAQLDDYQREYDAGSEVSPKARASMGGAGVLPPRGEVAAPIYDKASDTYQEPYREPVAAPIEQDAPQVARPNVVTSPSQQARERARTSLQNQRRR